MSQTGFHFDLQQPYLRGHLIAYIGNKRALLGFLLDVLKRLVSGREGLVFLDPFAGSGAVSRLAKAMGYRVLANDWEFYSYVLNYAHLCIHEKEARGLFRDRGGLAAVLEALNNLPAPRPEDRYISRYYAPKNTEKANYRRERLFYTRGNALIIDAVRTGIEGMYPGFEHEGPLKKEKMLLLASLLYQCATHTNTSGVFKACHKGFGGHGRDALGRIMRPIRLERPVLIDSALETGACCLDAEDFARRFSGDLCYLDPPYNQHQYGSNYHLLNTIARWDRPPVGNELAADGRLKHKAGIRKDWVKTRSPYCYKQSALPAFKALLDAIDARFILLSYNTEGIIPFEALVDVLSGQGRIELFTNEYVKYKGGKQSISRQVHNMEILLAVDRKKKTRKKNWAQIENVLARKKIGLILKGSFYPEKIAAAFKTENEAIILTNHADLRLPMPGLYRFSGSQDGRVSELPPDKLGDLFESLSACECMDKKEEIEILIRILRDGSAGERRKEYRERILWLLKKFAHKKYRSQFMQMLSYLKNLTETEPGLFFLLKAGLNDLERLARARFDG